MYVIFGFSVSWVFPVLKTNESQKIRDFKQERKNEGLKKGLVKFF